MYNTSTPSQHIQYYTCSYLDYNQTYFSRVAVHPTEEPENYLDEDDLEIININQL